MVELQTSYCCYKNLISPGKDNVVVDFLPRLTIDDNNIPTEDSFPGEYIFAISTYSTWYANIANYLATGKFP